MQTFTIQYTDKLLPEHRSTLNAGFERNELKKGVECDFKEFSIISVNDDGCLLGVVSAHTAFLDVHITETWVDEKCRGQGVGRRLLEALEQRFKGSKYNNLNVYSSGFEAPEFYVKCGFKVEFVRKNEDNPQYTKTYLVKYLKGF